jgi:hypothetical protein
MHYFPNRFKANDDVLVNSSAVGNSITTTPQSNTEVSLPTDLNISNTTQFFYGLENMSCTDVSMRLRSWMWVWVFSGYRSMKGTATHISMPTFAQESRKNVVNRLKIIFYFRCQLYDQF